MVVRSVATILRVSMGNKSVLLVMQSELLWIEGSQIDVSMPVEVTT